MLSKSTKSASFPATEALFYISRAGYLRASEIALLLYAGKVSAIQLARRLLKNLLAGKFVEAVKGPGGVLVYAIARKGCAFVEAELGETVSPTVSLLKTLGNFQHRCTANVAVIRHLLTPGPCVAWFEYEIQQGRLPIYQSSPAKIPDYAISAEQGVIWGEVECSKRSTTDRKALVNWLLDLLWTPANEHPELAPGLYLRQIEFIAPLVFEGQLHKWVVDALVDRGLGEGQAEQVAHDLLGYYTIVRTL